MLFWIPWSPSNAESLKPRTVTSLVFLDMDSLRFFRGSYAYMGPLVTMITLRKQVDPNLQSQDLLLKKPWGALSYPGNQYLYSVVEPPNNWEPQDQSCFGLYSLQSNHAYVWTISEKLGCIQLMMCELYTSWHFWKEPYINPYDAAEVNIAVKKYTGWREYTAAQSWYIDSFLNHWDWSTGPACQVGCRLPAAWRVAPGCCQHKFFWNPACSRDPGFQ